MTDYNQIEFERIPLAVIDDPNTALPYASFNGSDVLLRYDTNLLDESVNEVCFHNALMYRIGDPNDEGFYSDGSDRRNSTIYNTVNFPELDFDGLNEVFGVDWKSYLSSDDGFVSNPEHKVCDLSYLRHFIYFMKDGTFECVSAGCAETGLRPRSVLNSVHSEYTHRKR